MSTALPRSQLGVPNPRFITSEAQLLAELQSNRRPVDDVSFKSLDKRTTTFCAVKLGRLLLTETVTDPIVWKTTSNPQISFIIPISGGGRIVGSSQSKTWGGPHQLIQLSYAHPIEVHSEKAHVVEIVPSTEELEQSIAGMKFIATEVIENSLASQAEVHNGVVNGLDYLKQLTELLSIVKLTEGNGAYLSRIGINDVINRVLIEMLLAKAAIGKVEDNQSSFQSTRSGRAVSIICDYIMSNIGTPLTIPKMEAMVGLSGRALNYAFQDRYNCSPQEWQRNYLLGLARERLLADGIAKSVKSVAYELGFSSSSSFAYHYKKRFGELPTKRQKVA